MVQPKRKYKYDPLETVRKQTKDLILKNYRTIEEFCLVEDFQKSTLSRFLNPSADLAKRRTEYQIYTLYRLAEVFGKDLVIKFE